jgi:polyprenyl P-hydroxybenzoate/phenylacrylic acid decarboxylase-like protein
LKRELIVGITGASGSAVAVSLLRALLRQEAVGRIDLIVSDHALPVLSQELEAPGLDADRLVDRFLEGDHRVTTYRNDQLAAPIASGSCRTDGMLVVPCSVNTLAAIASGRADRLIDRAADVALKERRPLLLAVRETPLSATHLENMLKVTRNGAVVFPICPAFYARPGSTEEMLDNFVLRLLDHLCLEADRGYRWGGGPARG